MCIKHPEPVSSFKFDNIEVGPSMAVAIEHKTRKPFVIGTNQKYELGLGDADIRKSFTPLDELIDKQIENVGLGKSGFVVAIGQLSPVNEQVNSNVEGISNFTPYKQPNPLVE